MRSKIARDRPKLMLLRHGLKLNPLIRRRASSRMFYETD